MKRLSIVCVAALLAALADSRPSARTWYVMPDSTGDAPTIYAACDSAAEGDTLLLAPGEHVHRGNSINKSIVIVSESGPLVTKVVPYEIPGYFYPYGAFEFRGGLSVLEGLWIDGFDTPWSFSDLVAVSFYDAGTCYVRNNIFTGGASAALSFYNAGWALVENNTFVNNEKVFEYTFGFILFTHNIVLDDVNPSLNVIMFCNDIIGWTGDSSNFSADPLFCAEGDYRLQPDSPCAPGNSPLGDQCELIGALPVGCTPIPVKPITWGTLRSLYPKQDVNSSAKEGDRK